MRNKSTAEERLASMHPGGDRVLRDAVIGFLQARQYDEAAGLLQEAQESSERSGDTAQVRLLDTAQQICLTANRCVIAMESQMKAYQGAIALERTLQGQLLEILDLVSQYGTREIQEVLPALPTSEPGSQGVRKPESVWRLDFWQRFKSSLRRSIRSLSRWQETPANSDELPDSVFLREAEKPVSSAMAPTQFRSRERVKPFEVSAEESYSSPDEQTDLSTEFAFVDGKRQAQSSPSLTIYCLGRFQVYQDEQPIEEWLSSKGSSIFKYLVTNRKRPVGKEVLMELFWPEMDPGAARNNLNVAIYSLRQSLRRSHSDFSHILFQGGDYLLNPEVRFWVDVEEFTERFEAAKRLEKEGKLSLAIREYHAAEVLYQGEFLEEDRYEDWLLTQRHNLENTYLRLLDHLSRYYFLQEDYSACITICRKTLGIDPCLEETHRLLMRCYYRQGQRSLALRQYHLCVKALAQMLDVSPMSETVVLISQIRDNEAV